MCVPCVCPVACGIEVSELCHGLSSSVLQLSGGEASKAQGMKCVVFVCLLFLFAYVHTYVSMFCMHVRMCTACVCTYVCVCVGGVASNGCCCHLTVLLQIDATYVRTYVFVTCYSMDDSEDGGR